MKTRAHISVRGVVQGVFFRANTKKQAKKLGLQGWVRNSGMDVEAVFEGPKLKVINMLEWCKKGPRSAKVKDVKISWEKYTGEFKDFKILY